MVGGDVVAHLEDAGLFDRIGSFSDSGKGLMFGPRSTVSDAASAGAAGSSIILSLTRNASGIATRGHAPQVVGSVRTPRTALTAATSGLTR